MTKKNQAEFKRDKVAEEQFKKRYNREVFVYRAITLGSNGQMNNCCVHIVTPKGKYIITEYFKDDQTTDFVVSGKEDSPHKYNRYLDAEVYLADLMGEIEWHK